MPNLQDLTNSQSSEAKNNMPFEYGAVFSSTELEGCSATADWSYWEKTAKAPPSQGSGLRYSSDPSKEQANYTAWLEDLDQIVDLGVTSIAMTLEWAKLQPKPERHDENEAAFRLSQIQAAKDRGLVVWGCLVDGTLPGWFTDDEGGFNDDRSRGLLWPRHIDWVGETFGSIIDGWVPQRDPIHWALRRYLHGLAPPGKRSFSDASQAVRAAMLTEAEAWRLLRGTAPVATHQSARAISYQTDNVKAAGMARAMERLLWHPWVGALSDGKLEVGDLPIRAIDELKGAFDRVIVELRAPIRVDANGAWSQFPTDQPAGKTGFVAWPDAQLESLHRVTEALGDHLIFAAGNLGDVVNDGTESSAAADYQQLLMSSVADMARESAGQNPPISGIAGWWQTSPIDGYHYEHGFGLRPGLIRHDRTLTKAGEKFRKAASRRS